MKSTRGMTIVEVLITLVMIGFLVAIAAHPFIQWRSNALCEQFRSNIERVKEQVAAEHGLAFGQPIDPHLFVDAGLALTFNEHGKVICPHSQVVDVGNVGIIPFYHCLDGEPDRDCQKIRRQIQTAKVALAVSENLRWNDPVTVDQLKAIGISLSVNDQGQAVCPEGGIITINGPGQDPTCSAHQ